MNSLTRCADIHLRTNPAAPPPSEIDLRALIGEIGGPGARLQRHIITELVPKEAVHHDWQVLLAAAEVQRKWDREEEEAKHVKKAEKPAKKMRDPTAETPCVYLTCNMPEGRHGINCIGYKTREEEEQEAALEKARAEMLDLDGYPF